MYKEGVSHPHEQEKKFCVRALTVMIGAARSGGTSFFADEEEYLAKTPRPWFGFRLRKDLLLH